MGIPSSFEGGCACGAVRYRCDEAPLAMMKCHCVDCQKASGGPFMPIVRVSASAFRFTKGTPTLYRSGSTRWEHNNRGFCGTCGSRLTGGQKEGKPFLAVTASSLDDPAWFRPQMNIFVSQAQPWDKIDTDIPAHALYPPA